MSETKFRYINNIGDTLPNESIEKNLVSFTDWAFLEIGSYLNHNHPSSGNYGGSQNQLTPVKDPRFTNGTVWQSPHKNWIWESGVHFSPAPIAFSGIFINNSFHANGNGYHVDFPNGRVIFDAPLSSRSGVTAEYSHKYINVVEGDRFPDLMKAVTKSYRIDRTFNSGLLPDQTLGLPAVCFESAKQGTYQGFQLGGGLWHRVKVVAHVFSEDKNISNRIANIIGQGLKDQTLLLYDPQYVEEINGQPLDYRGSIKTGAKTYPQMIAYSGDGGYRRNRNIQHSKMTIIQTEEQGCYAISDNIYHHPVTLTIEVILPQSL